jgi:RNA polymerase sigma-70 factor, ECF subfamily
MDSTPASLIEQLRQRPAGAEWSQFVSLYSPVLLGWTRRLGVPESDRADLVQDTFVALLRALPASRYDPSRRFRNWLYAIIANLWKDRLRRRSPGPLTIDVPDASDDGADEAEYRAILLRRALQIVRPDYEAITWKAFVGTALDGRPTAAVAAELGVSHNVVYLARSRVLRRLRSVLGELFD